MQMDGKVIALLYGWMCPGQQDMVLQYSLFTLQRSCRFLARNQEICSIYIHPGMPGHSVNYFLPVLHVQHERCSCMRDTHHCTVSNHRCVVLQPLLFTIAWAFYCPKHVFLPKLPRSAGANDSSASRGLNPDGRRPFLANGCNSIVGISRTVPSVIQEFNTLMCPVQCDTLLMGMSC